MKKYLVAAVAVAVVAMPRAANADPLCTAAVTMLSFPGYVDCRGPFGGNINGGASEVAALAGYWGGSWVWLGKSDDAGNGPFTGAAVGSPAAGTIGFDSPKSGWLVIGVKQANGYSYYLFNELAPISSIAIDSRGTSDNNGFSHVGLYVGTGVPGGGGGPLAVAPEPASMMLLATGLVGLAGFKRRRKKA